MKLSSIFSDGMILQREKPIVIKGYARGNQVTITFVGKVFQTEFLEGDYFELSLPPMKAGGPYEMVLYDGEKTTISDIWIGDVYLLGGQSNMELPIYRTLDLYQEEVTNINENYIRMFQVPKEYDFQAEHNLIQAGSWIPINSKSIMEFSALGYFFAKDIYETYHIPIGLIHTAVGGTPIEAWLSEKALKEMKIWEEKADKNKEDKWVNQVIEADTKRIESWYQEMNENDRGIKERWYEKNSTKEFTHSFQLPQMWKDTKLENYKGSVWFTKEFELPKECEKKEAVLRLGAIIDADEAYVNGVLVGHTAYRYPPRKYELPPNLLQAGKNRVTLRVISDAQAGGFMPGKDYCLLLGEKKVSLEGEWSYEIGSPMKRLEPQTFFAYEPSGGYNKMIAPLKGVGVCGILFYQGESNTKNFHGYAKKLEKLIQVWREVLQEVPFLYVALAYFNDGKKGKEDSNWSYLREEQKKALCIFDTAMVDAYDLGEYNDLHPQNKKELAKRLSIAAKKLIYQQDITQEDMNENKIQFSIKIIND